MDPVDDFLERYLKEYDYYDEVGRTAARRIEASLEAAGLRAIVTSRAKSPARLLEKLRKRQPKKLYGSVPEIYSDIVDLAGVRVALYFPGDRDRVDLLIRKDFAQDGEPRVFPRDPHDPNKRFSGYAATHYRVRLHSGGPDKKQERYSLAKIEIQVASVLMHAWSEVEHDLAYKPTQGQLTARELGLLDQLNGLVLAGEIALEQLQAAGQERVAEEKRTFASHFDVAAYLLQRARELSLEEVSAEGLGRVDELFEMLRAIEILTPNQLAPYVDQLHNDIELRPLADQIIDVLLAEDSSRYEVYGNIRGRGAHGAARDQAASVGEFIARWIELEQLLREVLLSTNGRRRRPVPVGRELYDYGFLSKHDAMDFDQLRNMRNALVHGVETPPPDVLETATSRVQAFIELFNSRQD